MAQEEVNATELLIPLVDDSLLAGKSLQEIRDRAERVSALVVAAAEKAVARLQP